MPQADDLFADFPNVESLLDKGWLARVAKQALARHPLTHMGRSLAAGPLEGYTATVIPEMRRFRAREELKAIDRAIQIVRPIMDRSGQTARFRGALRAPGNFAPTVAELVAAARSAGMTTDVDTMVVDPERGGPDVEFDLGGRRVYAEVYAPKAWRDFDMADDIRGHFDGEVSGCWFHLIVTRHTKRDHGLAKKIAMALKAVGRRMLAEGAEVATFFGGPSGDLDVKMGVAEGVPEENLFVGWAYRGFSAQPMTSFVAPKYVPADVEADQALRGLDQLVQGATNVLVVDLSGKVVDPATEQGYQRATIAAGIRRPELAAVLLTSRQYVMRPAPSLDFEARTYYRAFATKTASAPLSPDELALLQAPGLLIPALSEPR